VSRRYVRASAELTQSFTVSQSASFSYRGVFAEVFTVSIKVEKADYEKAIQWIRDLVSGAIFDKER
jgi:Zn-dependent M16 (insulinase) family peptidase